MPDGVLQHAAACTHTCQAAQPCLAVLHSVTPCCKVGSQGFSKSACSMQHRAHLRTPVPLDSSLTGWPSDSTVSPLWHSAL